MKTYTIDEMKRAFECGRNFQLTGENNFQELIEALSPALPIHSVMQAEGSEGAEGAAVGIGGWVRGVRDWEEDFAHENGNYFNQCKRCDKMFMGHKRRVL